MACLYFEQRFEINKRQHYPSDYGSEKSVRELIEPDRIKGYFQICLPIYCKGNDNLIFRAPSMLGNYIYPIHDVSMACTRLSFHFAESDPFTIYTDMSSLLDFTVVIEHYFQFNSFK